jgi:signal transduction histidine kinase
VAGLTAGALLVGATLAYFEVRRSAIGTAEARLGSIVAELENLTTANQVQRGGMEQRIAESPLVRDALRGVPLDTGELSELLDSLRVDVEAGLPVAVLGRDGSVAFSTGSVGAPDPDPTPPLRVARAYGPLRPVGGLTLYWVTIPVPSGEGEPLGWIAHRRRLGSPEAGSTIALLLGSGIRVLLGTLSDSAWVDLSGAFVSLPPGETRLGEPFRSHTSAGEETLAVAQALSQPPWVVQADIPMAQVLERPHAFRNSALAVGSLLTLLTIFLAWRAGRRLGQPLVDLATAADAIAGGDYGRRVEVQGDDEAGRLARAFNAMSLHVEESDEALRQKLEEAQALALRLEEAMRAAESAREEAQRASRAKSEFLATMSHEIRTPISAVIGYIDLLARGIPDEPTKQQRHYLKRIEGANEHLISLVNDLLDFARMESGEMRVEREVASAHGAVSAALSALEPQAATKGVRLTGHCPEDLQFLGDAQRVRQIALNLVSNAIKFTRSGGSVTARGARSDMGPPGREHGSGERWVRIDVEDDGMGIEPGQMARMFEPFVQGPRAPGEDHGGTGLGLAISRRLALLMSGALTAESTPGEGSTFTLWLPAAPAVERAGSADDPHGSRQRHSPVVSVDG